MRDGEKSHGLQKTMHTINSISGAFPFSLDNSKVLNYPLEFPENFLLDRIYAMVKIQNTGGTTVNLYPTPLLFTKISLHTAGG